MFIINARSLYTHIVTCQKGFGEYKLRKIKLFKVRRQTVVLDRHHRHHLIVVLTITTRPIRTYGSMQLRIRPLP